jgi:hypothetical protein
MTRIVANTVALIVVFAAAVGGAWYFRTYPVDLAQVKAVFIPPCVKPIAYRVGSIDPRFALSKSDIIAELGTASAIWNDAAGKPVLAYAPDDTHALVVNFVYDARQQTVTLGQKIDSTEESQQAEHAAIDALQQAYASAQQSYASAVAAFNEASRKHAEEVRQVNAAGGADPTTYARLQSEQEDLKNQQEALRAKGDALAAQGKELESRIHAFNAGVHQINQIVQAFNSTVGGEFEEGLYVREASGAEHIDIYAYKTKNELLHSLTHEFGHAIGLGHNENPGSIMFPYNKSGVTLSKDDIADLKSMCKL